MGEQGEGREFERVFLAAAVAVWVGTSDRRMAFGPRRKGPVTGRTPAFFPSHTLSWVRMGRPRSGMPVGKRAELIA